VVTHRALDETTFIVGTNPKVTLLLAVVQE